MIYIYVACKHQRELMHISKTKPSWGEEQFKSKQYYEGQSKITEPYLITFSFGIVENECVYFL